MSPVKILIVEDEAIIAETTQRSLLKLGYTVTGVAISAAEAIRLAKATSPDLVLMDISIKGAEDGITAAIALNKEFDVPVVFLTAHTDPATLERARTALPFGYLVKPFEAQGLRATIEMALYRIQAERKNRQMERWLAATLHSIADGVVAVDAEGRVNFLNAEAERLTGLLRHEAIGRDYREVLRFVNEDTLEPVAHPVPQALQSNVVIHLESNAALVAHDGRVIPVDDSAAPTRDNEGRITGVVIIVRDRSERKRSEEERRRIEQKMQEAQRLESLGVLASGIAHDFNNLLTIITGNISLVAFSHEADSSEKQSLVEASEAAGRAADLCAQLLAYAGKNKIFVRPLDLSAEVASTLALMKLSISKAAKLALNLARDLPPVSADASQLRQVIMNLVMNASEALGGGEGEIHFTTGLVHAGAADFSKAIAGSELPAGEYVLMEVRDTGCGMSPAVQERIFDPFFTTKFLGRGLGLAAVLGIVRSHGGALTLASAPGAGTTFRVYFPKSAADATTEAPSTAGPVDLTCTGTVLVADDDDEVRTVVTRMVEALGFAVITAVNGVEALAAVAARETPLRLAVLDVVMPEMDGITAARFILEENPDLPILFISGYTSEQLAERFPSGGSVRFLAKPFTTAAFEDAVKTVLQSAGTPSHAAATERIIPS
jgi:two-component system, cell cycle sensor histidine kinase and response regulator CckA